MSDDVFPFVRFAWKSKAIADQWEKLLQKMTRLAYWAEYESVRVGLREANVYHLSAGNFDKEVERVFLDGMVWLPILRSQTYAGYSHRHRPTKVIDKNTHVFGVVARDLETAEKYRAANTGIIDHTTIGEMLGYPVCCVEFFNENWPNGIVDMVFETSQNTNGEHSPMLNTTLRYFGLKIIPHFSGRISCGDSIKFAEEWYGLMIEKDKQTAEGLLEVLSMPVKWSLNNYIIDVDHELFHGATNGYKSKYKEVKLNGYSS